MTGQSIKLFLLLQPFDLYRWVYKINYFVSYEAINLSIYFLLGFGVFPKLMLFRLSIEYLFSC